MKKLKKTVCILLAMLLLCGIFAVQVSAQEEQEPDMDALLETFKGYLDEHNALYEDHPDYAAVEFIVESNGWTIFKGTPGIEGNAFTSDGIGKYVFVSESWSKPYGIGLYAEKDKNILTLKEAYNTGEIDIDKIANCGAPQFIVYFAGDTNRDKVVNLTDVLNVQKAVAKQIGVSELFEFVFFDYDGDDEIKIEDVLDMQKSIAKIA